MNSTLWMTDFVSNLYRLPPGKGSESMIFASDVNVLVASDDVYLNECQTRLSLQYPDWSFGPQDGH